MSGDRLHDLAFAMVTALVEDEGAVRVDLIQEQLHLVVRVEVAPNETGMVIGRHGYIAESLRNILHAVAHRLGLNECLVVIHDPRPAMRKNRVVHHLEKTTPVPTDIDTENDPENR